jgi:hypothetical protein
MRNRYIVIFTLALTAFTFAGCRSNPEKAKHKYFDSGMKFMDAKNYEAASIQFKREVPARLSVTVRRTSQFTGAEPPGKPKLEQTTYICDKNPKQRNGGSLILPYPRVPELQEATSSRTSR